MADFVTFELSQNKLISKFHKKVNNPRDKRMYMSIKYSFCFPVFFSSCYFEKTIQKTENCIHAEIRSSTPLVETWLPFWHYNNYEHWFTHANVLHRGDLQLRPMYLHEGHISLRSAGIGTLKSCNSLQWRIHNPAWPPYCTLSSPSCWWARPIPLSVGQSIQQGWSGPPPGTGCC